MESIPLSTPVYSGTFNKLFQVVRCSASVVRFDGGRFQPRLHDFRSTFAVHRIAAWYERGIDAQKVLPALGAYLGQVGLVSMNRHLSLTPEHYRKHLPAPTTGMLRTAQAAHSSRNFFGILDPGFLEASVASWSSGSRQA